MASPPNLYDLCDGPLLQGSFTGQPAAQLRLLYKKAIAHPALKWGILRWCRHPEINDARANAVRSMFLQAMDSRIEHWNDPVWLDRTFAPLASLLDEIPATVYQERTPVVALPEAQGDARIRETIDIVLQDIHRVWNRDPEHPWFPVAAQVVLTGDDPMDGTNFRSVLKGLGSIEYQAIFVLFSLVRCFITANPRIRKWLVRAPFQGICEPMYHRVGWIWHRTAYYDGIFFDQLLAFVEKGDPSKHEKTRILAIMEHLVRFNVVTSQEPSVTPRKNIVHPAITCLPKDEQGMPLCHMSAKDWKRKADLGFSDFVPDVDTTFLTLSMAEKWIKLAGKKSDADPELLRHCETLLSHPWPAIIGEYQINGQEPNPPTIQISKPLDYTGAVPIWFDKTFKKADGRILREALGNEVCPGHNMDILEALLANEKRWNSLSDDNLPIVQAFLDFQHRAFSSGNALLETAYIYYLPEINMYYAGRVYAAYNKLREEQQCLLDPSGKIRDIRMIALKFCRENILGQTFNVFDASLAVAALCLLEDDEPGHVALHRGLKLLVDSAGEGSKGHPYKAYEWNKMRHPTRILVGSEVSTSLFVLNALAEARAFLAGR